MKTLSISYPESLLGSLHVSESEFEREARMAMAVKLFDTGRLSSGQAAELATTPIFPPSGPTQWLFQGPPADSKFLAIQFVIFCNRAPIRRVT